MLFLASALVMRERSHPVIIILDDSWQSNWNNRSAISLKALFLEQLESWKTTPPLQRAMQLLFGEQPRSANHRLRRGRRIFMSNWECDRNCSKDCSCRYYQYYWQGISIKQDAMSTPIAASWLCVMQHSQCHALPFTVPQNAVLMHRQLNQGVFNNLYLRQFCHLCTCWECHCISCCTKRDIVACKSIGPGFHQYNTQYMPPPITDTQQHSQRCYHRHPNPTSPTKLQSSLFVASLEHACTITSNLRIIRSFTYSTSAAASTRSQIDVAMQPCS